MTALCPALKDAARPGLGVGVEEDQELLVQIPGEEQGLGHLLPVQTLCITRAALDSVVVLLKGLEQRCILVYGAMRRV